MKNKDSLAGKEKEPLVDDTSSEEKTVDQELRTTEEERSGTIPGLVQATAMALMCSCEQVNPSKDPSKDIKRRIKIHKLKLHR